MIYSTILPQLYQSSTNHNYSSSLTYKLLHKYRLLNKGHKKDRFDYITAILPIPSYVKNIPVPGFELNRIYDKRPTFTQRLRSRVIQESLHVKLSCLIDSDSNAQVTWARGRTILLPGDLHYDIRFNHGICTLEIQSCQMADMAEYTCKVENQYGFDETSAFLCVERRSKKPNDTNIEMSDIKPSFEKPLERQDTTDKQRETTKIVKKKKTVTFAPHILEHIESMTVYEGAAIMLQCRIDGKPVPTAEWLHDGQKLVSGNKIEIRDDPDCPTLLIRDITKNEEGEYSCIVTNSVGSDSTIADVVVKLRPEITQKDSYETEVNEVMLNENDDQTTEFEDGVHGIEDQLIQESIPNKDIGKKDAQTLSITKHLQGQSLHDGEALHLFCEMEGVSSDEISVEWTRNWKVIPDNPDFLQKQDGLRFSLDVAEMFPEDSGNFGIRISSGNQTCESICSILVQEENNNPDPSIVEYPQSLTVVNADSAEFSCTVTSTQLINASWYFNDVIIDESNPRYQISNTDGPDTFKLKISDVQLSDEGTYYITISNGNTDVSALVSLQVIQN